MNRNITLVYQKALELMNEEAQKRLMEAIAERKRYGRAQRSTMQFRITAKKPLTLRGAKKHALGHGIKWKELKPYPESAEVYWEKVSERIKDKKRS